MKSQGLISASLKDKTVFITGGGAGIGFATAKLFAEMEANVAINFFPGDLDSQKRVKNLKKNFPNISLFPGDVSKEDEVQKIILKIIHKYTQINFLVNNVGIGLVKNPIPFERLDLINDKFWDEIMKVNLMSAFYCSKFSEQYLKKILEL